MDMNELMNRILFLVPAGKFTIWENTPDQYAGEINPVPLSNFLVDWSRTNINPCPTQEQVDGVNLNAANQQSEARRKSGRNQRYQNDLAIKAAFKLERRGNPNLTFSDFLDQLESDPNP